MIHDPEMLAQARRARLRTELEKDLRDTRIDVAIGLAIAVILFLVLAALHADALLGIGGRP